MIVVVQANVLSVGLNGKRHALKELPIRVITMQSGYQAARSLKNENVDSVISSWDLADMKDGQFLKRLKAVKPGIPTIAVVKRGDKKQEIAARSLGVSAVVSEDTSDAYFRQVICQLLGLEDAHSIKAIKWKRQKSAAKAVEEA